MQLLVFSMLLVLAVGNPLDNYEDESPLDPSNVYMLPLSAQVTGERYTLVQIHFTRNQDSMSTTDN